VGKFRTGKVGVFLLEELIPAVFEGTLGRVAKEGRAPTGEDTADSLAMIDGLPSLDVTLVQRRVDLASSLDKIQRSNGRVGQALEV
jgi:hypothetical protein